MLSSNSYINCLYYVINCCLVHLPFIFISIILIPNIDFILFWHCVCVCFAEWSGIEIPHCGKQINHYLISENTTHLKTRRELLIASPWHFGYFQPLPPGHVIVTVQR